jgi:hypothetical protein
MKKLLYIFLITIIISSCATSQELTTRNERKLAKQEMIKNAIESKRFIIKFEHIYPSWGGLVQLYPKYNYIVVDGDKAIIHAAYFGRQYSFHPIAGFNMRGKALDFEANPDNSKGSYDISMTIGNDKNAFNVDLTVGRTGTVSASISALKTDYIRYRGYIEPIKDRTN